MGSFKKVRQFRNSLFSQVFTYGLFSTMGKIIFPGNIPNTSRHFELHHQPPPRKKTHISFNRYFDVFSLTEFEAKKNIGRFIERYFESIYFVTWIYKSNH